MIIALFTICLLAIAVPQARSQQPTKPLYQNEKAPIAARVRDLLGRMTLDEKVAQLQSGLRLPGGNLSPNLFEKDHLNEEKVKQTLGKWDGNLCVPR